MSWVTAITLALKAIDTLDDLIFDLWNANKDDSSLDPAVAEDLAQLVKIRDESRAKRNVKVASLREKLFGSQV